MKLQLTLPNIDKNIYYKQNSEFFLFILDLIQNFRAGWNKKLQMNCNKKYLDWIILNTNQLKDPYYTLKTKLYWILYGITAFPRCKICGKPILNWNVKSLTKPYNSYCCIRCKAKDKKIKEKRQQTCLKKYGAKTIMESNFGKKQYQLAIQKLYGTTNIQKNKKIREKTNNTCQQRYGGNAPICLTEIKHKIQTTNIKKYGGICPAKNSAIIQKISTTYYKKTGFNWPSQNPTIQSKIHKKYTFMGIGFDSAPEIAFYMYCIDHNIKCIHEPINKTLQYVDKYNLSHTYIPDFYLPDSQLLIEIKGNNHFDKTGKMIYISNRNKDYIDACVPITLLFYELLYTNGI